MFIDGNRNTILDNYVVLFRELLKVKILVSIDNKEGEQKRTKMMSDLTHRSDCKATRTL